MAITANIGDTPEYLWLADGRNLWLYVENGYAQNTVDGLDSEWFYRADLGNWQKYFPLSMDMEFPFPHEFDEFFIILLTIKLNPAYGTSLDPQSQLMFNRSKTQIRARYTQNIPTRSELALIRPAKVAADRDQWGNTYWLYQPNAMFDKGWPW